METQVEFRSNRFPAFDWKSRWVNPGRYGKGLADFIHAGMADAGLAAGDPRAEDWGWVVPLRHEGFPLWVGCGNYDQHPGDGFLCFIEPHTPTVRRFPWLLRTDTTRHVAAVRQALDRLLTGDRGIRDVRWFTYEAFTGVGRAGK